MATYLPFLEQNIREHNVVHTKLPGRGNGLVAARDISPRSQLLFVRQPLMNALDTARLQDTCYQCLRGAFDHTGLASTASEKYDLKACAGCRTVRFCHRTCQKLAWNRFHKHECKIFSKLHPRVLPSSTRALLRLLLERKHSLISEEEWQQILSMEAHQDDFSKAGSTRWQDLCLIAKAVHSYSGTGETLDTVLRLCCILTVNSFTLTNDTCEPLGVIFHPLPALMNHSCTPNAYIRFDIVPPSPPPGTTPRHPGRLPPSTISVHALEEISRGAEITVSYIDATLPTPDRKSELSSQYFFTCSCPLCGAGPNAITDALMPLPTPAPRVKFEDVKSLVLSALTDCTGSSSAAIPVETKIAEVRYSLSLLANTGCWPLHRYPGPQLRRQLILLLIEAEAYEEALDQAVLKSRVIDEILYPSEYHPIRIAGLWMVFQLARLVLIDTLRADPTIGLDWISIPMESEVKMLSALMFNELNEIMGIVLPPKSKNAKGPQTEMGRVVRAAMEKKLDSARGTLSTQGPPPYVGPEAPPEGLPEYQEDFDDLNDDYPASKAGKFEMRISMALAELTNGESRKIWADWEDDKLADVERTESWVDKWIRRVYATEGLLAKAQPQPV